jgi:hydroxyacylglutathione hydrolase
MITADPAATAVIPLPAFTDNYLWLITRGTEAVVVDPGDGAVVLDALKSRGLSLSAILVTHHHPDHIGGLGLLRQSYDVPVYGPRGEAATIGGLSVLLDDGDRVQLPELGLELKVLSVPGHTLGHIAFFSEADRATARPPWLFCGDTLFRAGCGRLFEGTPLQMHDSLSRLAALPAETVVFCAHEYTLANLDFARAVEPDSPSIAAEIIRVKALRAASTPSVPSTIERERAINPFLRCDQRDVVAAAQQQAGTDLHTTVDVFASLRRWKDGHHATLT